MKMKWFKLKKPVSPKEQFGGRSVTCYPTAQDARDRKNAERLVVEHICGNLRHQTMFQINGTHLVSMLDAYCELNGEPLPEQDTHEGFLSTVSEHIAPAAPAVAPPKAEKSLIDRKPNG